MECPQCHSGNRDSRRFCAKCGTPLAAMCPECGFVNEPHEDFCGGCGKALTGDKVPISSRRELLEPERRQLTVMFCDLEDSTALSHQLDPEDLREVIRSYQKCANQVIARYEGFVARYMGDGMLVYFGYPRAHEDNAARAIDTGLKIVEALEQLRAVPDRVAGGRLGVRIGIATGLVVAGDLIGEGVSEEAQVVGETPNLAARLQALAKSNSVVVDQSTRELAGGLFEYADQGVHRLKGFQSPVRAWRVLRASEAESRFGAARSGRLTPLVGRESEMNFLRQWWQRAKARHGQVVLLSGEPGIGKSRLAESLGEQIAAESHIRLRYQCSAYHTNSALYPFIHELERTADLGRADTAEQKRDKLEAFLAKSIVHMDAMAPLFAALLSLPASSRYPRLDLTPQQLKDKTLLALLERLRGLAGQAPVLILIEDAHWIDPTSTEFLSLLAHHSQGLPVLAIVTSRSAAAYSWLALPHVSSMQLERLDRHQSAAIVTQLLGRKKLPAEMIEEIVAKTDGVPLFIEELTKTLTMFEPTRKGAISAPAVRAGIPSTLQDSLMARLDRLGSAKEVAQMGAVIGREFSRDLLAAISTLDNHELGDALSALTSSAIVFDRGEPPGTMFMFKHALMEDAAYASLLRSKRQELHCRIARTLEDGYPERVRVEPEVVARHYTQASQFLPAAKYWAAAAQRALDRSANLEALRQATEGLELLPGVQQSAERDRLELGLEILRGTAYRAVKGFASSDAERSFTRARELCEQLADIRGLIDARRGLFSCYYARGALALAREQGQEVALSGRKLNDSSSQMLGHWMLGCIMFWQGDFATARRELEQAYLLYDPNEQRGKTLALQIDPGVNALLHLSWSLWILGYPEQAVQTSDRAIKIARHLSQPFALAMALFFACATGACCGHDDSVRQQLDELKALTAEHGLQYLGSCARVLEAQSLIAQDQCVASLELIDRAFADFRAQEAAVGLPWAMSILAAAYTRLGRAKEGLATLSEAFSIVGRNGEHHWEAELCRLKGELLLLFPVRDEAEAEACFRSAIDLARRQGARSLGLRGTMSLAELLSRQNKTETAWRVLGEAYTWFKEGLDTKDLRKARTMLQILADCPEKR
jgi:class 3 adenylate cyclase/tetratricopeptide (TPR) repeat protein